MSDESHLGLHFDWIKQWSRFIERCNWYDFTFIRIEVDDDGALGGLEATIILLGVGFRVCWNHTVTPRVREIWEQARAIKVHEAVEPRVAKWLAANGIDGGDDPVPTAGSRSRRAQGLLRPDASSRPPGGAWP